MRVTRRDLLKLGALGGAGLALPLGTLQIPLARIRQAEGVASPPVAAFQVPLPIPPILRPTRSDGTTDYYEITQEPGHAHILPGRTTPIWGYNGIFPGPTIEARSGRRVVVRQVNRLPTPVSTHLHGSRTPPASDGDPMDLVWPVGSHGDMGAMPMNMPRPGQPARPGVGAPGTPIPGLTKTVGVKDYIYPNDQRGATLWYHDHRMDFTGAQVYKGLAGFYILRDDVEERLPLPTGARDIPLMIADRLFNADGSFFYPSIDPSLAGEPGVLGMYAGGVYGDTILVNGAVQPVLEVSNVRYRFRILNASNARQYTLALDAGRPFVQVGSDGGLLAAPLTRRTITMAEAERFDVVIDFSAYPVGTRVVLRNLQGAGRTADIMCFDVVRTEVDDSAIPATLSPLAVLNPASAATTRTMQFYQGLGMWTINGRYFDPARADASPRLGSTEIWELSADASHPIHLHLVPFQVLSRDGGPPGPDDAGWKDTVSLRSGETARIIMTFTGYRGPYVFHCHNLEHEDMRMMGRFEVV